LSFVKHSQYAADSRAISTKSIGFGDWLQKNNPRIAKRLLKKQLEEKKKKEKAEAAAVTATTA
jgi:GrpB-like predicted nucleotidyltransferase (UPF0157 family)